MDWKPIETAPHMNTVLVYMANADCDQMDVACLYLDSIWRSVMCADGLECHSQPTHWMPLPEPPNAR